MTGLEKVMYKTIATAYDNGKRAAEEGKSLKITEQLESIAAEICDKYCKYPATWDEEKDGPLCESSICATCPLTRL